MEEVLALVKEAGFEVTKAYYSILNDLTFIDAEPSDYLRLSSYRDLVRVAIKRPTKLNALRVLAYPIVRLRPNLRQLMVVVG